jgi:hypothetical protein
MFTDYKNTPKKKTGPNLSEGRKVSHPKFGIGIIQEKLGRNVFTVAFENNVTKNIHYDYLKLV